MSIKFQSKLSILAVIVVGSLVGGILQRKSIYNYPVSNDYLYDFSDSHAKNIDLQIESDELGLPAFNQNEGSAILSIHLSSSPLGYILAPSIEIVSGNQKITQTFEHGASGIRYLNVSRFVNNETQRLNIYTHFLRIANTTVHLWTFPKLDISRARILVIAPHPDDAEIASFNLYSSTDSYIATLTAGEGGKNTYDEIYPDVQTGHTKKGELRVWDSLFVPFIGGVMPDHTVNLGYFDMTLDKMYANKTQAVFSVSSGIRDIQYFRSKNVSRLINDRLTPSSTWQSLVNDITFLLTSIKPDIIVAPYPALDEHKDHKYASIALFEAIKQLQLTKGQLFLYTNHSVYNDFYPYGEIGSSLSLPPNFGVSPYISSIYSFSSAPDSMKNKLFALEAMHDVRLNLRWMTPKGAFHIFRKSLKKTLFGHDESQLRKAVRDNELFFVIPVSDIYDDTVMKKLQGW